MDILDASALIAEIRKEKGWESINDLLVTAETECKSVFMHQINFIEFIYKCRQLYNADKFNNILADLSSPFIGITNYFDSDIALYCSFLKSSYHLSLADSVGLAYTKLMNGTFWTADTALNVIAEKEAISLKLFR